MKVFLDERCLSSRDFKSLVLAWNAIVDASRKQLTGVLVFIDRNFVNRGDIKRSVSGLPVDIRKICIPLLYSAEYCADWRPGISNGRACAVAGEPAPIDECGVCEAYEHRHSQDSVAVFGSAESSYSESDEIHVHGKQHQLNGHQQHDQVLAVQKNSND